MPLSTLDRVTRQLLQRYYDPSQPPLLSLDIQTARDIANEYFADVSASWRTDDGVSKSIEVVPGGSIIVHIYRPPSRKAPRAGVLWFHGGGWILGSATAHEPWAREICRRTGAVVLDVDYPKAPEVRFPQPILTGLDVLRWVAKGAGELGIDPERLMVGGESAGAQIALGVASLAAQSGVSLARHIAVLPVTSLSTHSKLCAKRYDRPELLFTWADLVGFIELYLEHPCQSDCALASPALYAPPSGLCPAEVIVGECDMLHPHGSKYVTRLLRSRIPARLVRIKGAIHNSLEFGPVTTPGKRILAAISRAVRGSDAPH